MSLKDKSFNFATLRGEVVYRVVGDVGTETDEWIVYGVKVKTASDRRIELERPFPGLGGTRFQPSALGRTFHVTKTEAAQDFVRRWRQEINFSKNKIKRATQGLAWAHKNYPSVDVELHEISEVNALADRPVTKEKARG